MISNFGFTKSLKKKNNTLQLICCELFLVSLCLNDSSKHELSDHKIINFSLLNYLANLLCLLKIYRTFHVRLCLNLSNKYWTLQMGDFFG